MSAQDEATEQLPARPKRRRRPGILHAPASRGVGEEWMLTYMDTVTLLVTLFVLLLSFSTINKEKFASVAEALSLKKYGDSILLSRKPPIVAVDEKVQLSEPQEKQVSEDSGPTLEGGMRAELESQGLTDTVKMTVRENVIDLQLNESVLFVTGEAGLIEGGFAVVEKLAPFLVKTDFPLSIEGHTDNVPIGTELFPSNWELSAARAASVARALIDGGMSADRIHIRGYADTRPVASNETPKGRSRNRRVNLVLKTSEKAEGEK